MRLAKMICIYHAFNGLKAKVLAAEIGISTKQLAALEDDKKPSGEVLAKVTIWMWNDEKPSAGPANKSTQEELGGING